MIPAYKKRTAGAGGGIALLFALACYVKAKGRSAWWLLVLVLNVLGLAMLAFLPDRGTAAGEGAVRGHAMRRLLSHVLLSSAQFVVALIARTAFVPSYWTGGEVVCAIDYDETRVLSARMRQ